MKCEIPNTPNLRAAIKELKKVSSVTTFTLYVRDSKGKVMPVMDVAKHPDCPEELFSKILNLITNTEYYVNKENNGTEAETSTQDGRKAAD